MSSGGLACRIRRLCAASLVLLASAMPVHAFQTTVLADGGFEYFFAAHSLDIRSAGDLDLTGLGFIEGVEGGFRVGASFNLDWLGGENAWLASSASTWSGFDTQPRTLSFVAGGSLALGTTRLTLLGGTISLTAGGTLVVGNGSVFDAGYSGGVDIGVPGLTLHRPPAGTPGGGTLRIEPGGAITLTGPSPIPEPTAATLMLAGLLALAGITARRAKAES